MDNNKSVAIIGGGISGLVCGGHLKQLGISDVTIFDTGKHGPGGRASSRLLKFSGKQFIFDHAAQYFTVSDQRFANITSFLLKQNCAQLRNGNIGTLKNNGEFLPSNNQHFISCEGFQSIPKVLSKLTKIRNPMWVSSVEWLPELKKWMVDDHGLYDYIVIAHNGKCAAKLLSTANVEPLHRLLKVRFACQLNNSIPQMQLCSLYVLCAIIPSEQVHSSFKVDGAHLEDNVLSWIANNSTKYPHFNKDNEYQCWTIISSKQFTY